MAGGHRGSAMTRLRLAAHSALDLSQSSHEGLTMKDIQSPKADTPNYQQAPKNPEFALPEGLRRERKPPYDIDQGYNARQRMRRPRTSRAAPDG
jgi:hypothetical protein